MLIASLTTGHKLGLGLTAGAFIVFALIVSMVIPRFRPNFPGERGFKTFLAVAGCLFVATLLAVELFGVEPKEAAGKAPVDASPKIRATRGPIVSQPSAADIARGKTLYTNLGCIGCHSLNGAAGTGPTWKGLYGSQVALADGTTVTADAAYLAQSINDPDAATVKGFQPGIMSAVDPQGRDLARGCQGARRLHPVPEVATPGVPSARSERCPSWPKERDWKSRTCGNVGRGFESRPLRSFASLRSVHGGNPVSPVRPLVGMTRVPRIEAPPGQARLRRSGNSRLHGLARNCSRPQFTRTRDRCPPS